MPAHGEVVALALCSGLRQIGWRNLPISDLAQQWLQRVRWLSDNNVVDNFPSFGRSAFAVHIRRVGVTLLNGINRRSQLSQVDWLAALQSQLDYAQQQQLDRLAPTHLVVPTGSRIALDYSGVQPVLPVRLQEMFGQKTRRVLQMEKYPC